jgi:hypothetical protein
MDGNEIKYNGLKSHNGIITNADGIAFATWFTIKQSKDKIFKRISFCPGYKYLGKLQKASNRIYPNKSLIIPEPTTERLYAWKKNGERMATR